MLDNKIDLFNPYISPNILQYCASAHEKTNNFIILFSKDINLNQIPEIFAKLFKQVEIRNYESTSILIQTVMINDQLEYYVVHYGQSSKMTQLQEFAVLSRLLIVGDACKKEEDIYELEIPEEQQQRVVKILENLSITYNLNNVVLLKYYMETLRSYPKNHYMPFLTKFIETIQTKENINLETLLKQDDAFGPNSRTQSNNERPYAIRSEERLLQADTSQSNTSSIFQKSTLQTRKEVKLKILRKNMEQQKLQKKKKNKRSMKQQNFTEEKVQIEAESSINEQKIIFSNSYEDAEIEFDTNEEEEEEENIEEQFEDDSDEEEEVRNGAADLDKLNMEEGEPDADFQMKGINSEKNLFPENPSHSSGNLKRGSASNNNL